MFKKGERSMKRCKLLLLLLISIMLVLVDSSVIYAKRSEINYQAELEYPPYKYLKNGYLTGFDIELSNMIFETEEYDVHYSIDKWPEVFNRLTKGDIELAGLMVVTEQRKKTMLFSDTVFENHLAIYAKRRLQDRIDLKSLKNYKIGLGEGQSESVLKSGLGINNVKEYTTIPEALKALQTGEIDILIENQEVVDYLIVDQGLQGSIVKKLSDLYPRHVAFAISKNTPELVTYINKRLVELHNSGAFEELYQQYFFTHSQYYRDLIYKKVIEWIIILLALLLIIVTFLKMYINYLRRKIYSEQQFFGDVIEHSGMVVWALQADKEVVRFNKYAEQMTGLSESQVLGKSIENIDYVKGNTAVIRDLLEMAVQHDYVSNIELKLPDNSPTARYFSFRTTL